MTDTTLPTLTGSDKQIAWATDIRAALLAELDAAIAAALANPGFAKLSPAAAAEVQAALAAIAAEERAPAAASYWIERRLNPIVSGPLPLAAQALIRRCRDRGLLPLTGAELAARKPA